MTLQQTNARIFPKAGFILGVLGLACVVTVGLFFIQKPSAPSHFAEVTGLPVKTLIEAVLLKNGHSETLSSRDGVIAWPQFGKGTPAFPYRLSTSLKLPGDQYRDFILTVGKDGKSLNVLADGFHAADKISLTLNGVSAYQKIPMDWSGRLELETAISMQNPVEACISIVGQTESLGLCHIILPKGAA